MAAITPSKSSGAWHEMSKAQDNLLVAAKAAMGWFESFKSFSFFQDLDNAIKAVEAERNLPSWEAERAKPSWDSRKRRSEDALGFITQDGTKPNEN